MLRRLHHDQPASFAFTPANQAWAEKQVTKYPEGRQASAVIPLLWRAQEQEGWLSRAAIEYVADMLGMDRIRALEVATFYFMFQLKPVGSVAHVQVCGTTTCMICGAENLIEVCKEKIAPSAFQLSADGKFSWEEVECLGACANAPMAQIGKDYYEDLTTESFGAILDALARGEVPRVGSQTGRFASEPAGGLTSLTTIERTESANASVVLAHALGDTVKRIDGTEKTASDLVGVHTDVPPPPQPPAPHEVPTEDPHGDETERGAPEAKGKPARGEVAPGPVGDHVKEIASSDVAPSEDAETTPPELLTGPRGGDADDLKKLKGVGPKLEGLLNEIGVYHFDQIAGWGPAEIAWVDDKLNFRGRIERDDWVAQAQALMAEKGEGDA